MLTKTRRKPHPWLLLPLTGIVGGGLFYAIGATVVVIAAVLPGTQASPIKQGKLVTIPPKPLAAGEKVFQTQCAPCHGQNGEGTGAYPRQLAGSRSVGQLAKYIASAMPPGPKHCSATDASKVAAFLYDSFYSPIAQERNRPARIALARLTIRQFRNSVTDILGSFRAPVPVATKQGLRAEYYKSDNFDNQNRVIERVDPAVTFDFGQQGPSGGAFDSHKFSIRWDGSLLAPDTGMYDIIVTTEHATRLWLNDDKTPVLDAWVKSGSDKEHRVSVYLVGGCAYPIRLEFSKSTQGVNDADKLKNKPAPKASVMLSWKRPKQPEEPISARYLLTNTMPESCIVTSAFPPDDRSMGYERGNSISKEWSEATMAAALETSDYVVAHLSELAGTTDDPTKLRAFSRKFVERALRRPLDTDTANLYVERLFKTAPDPATAVKRVVLLTLMSPRFLYRELGVQKNDPYDVASRLSFALWDSVPDDTLLQAAASGQLATRAQVAAQAERMVADPRAWYKQRDFFLQWLKVDQYPDLAKDAKRFPDFSPVVAADLRTSLDLTLESVVRSGHSDFRELMQTNKYFLNGRLAAIYGVPLPKDAPFQLVTLDPAVRSGILTHPYILASFAYIGTSSPIHRGVLLARNVMGRTLAPPPMAFVPLAASLHPDLTTRERVSLQTKPTTCQSCHGIINPLGFTLERFDAIGRLRSLDNNKKVDASGSYEGHDGKQVKFTGARDLAQYVAGSDEAHAAFVEKFFQFMIKQPIRAYGPNAKATLQRDFQANAYSIRQLAVEVATEAALPKQVARK